MYYDADAGGSWEGDGVVYLENISWWLFLLFCLFDLKLWTANGKKKAIEHLRDGCQCGYGATDAWVYRCQGCGEICCACFGGAPDPRCDNCVAKEIDG